MNYTVVVNHEEQYSVWPAATTPPEGWREVGFSGTREACLAHIATVWTDIRPASARAAAR
ncbi:MbtH family protein [Amycolatopsis sp. BJA-103]|uniref:MbtH family protein n=1 Tax=unclassified Amycolatopsis TaxID=2618356 RepID=UPI000C77016E|nr:MbtH family protein [Amycolatopsis sp. BJA-103]AUI58225.1 antibiotic synthesis protein MbtH [Amycolatopsis sp. BJA-103]PNE14912.1 antibiotic synthesis protein MbtH [Amycolatopsis sp. BJA-103]